MESIFDIFGSHDAVKPQSLHISQRLPAVKGVSSTEGKHVIKPGSSTLKGKKVLSDVGNKINGLIKKSECTQQEPVKKPQQESDCTSKISPKVLSQDTQESICQENTDVSSQKKSLLSSKPEDFSKYPKVETQGSLFWSDDDYNYSWEQEDQPNIEDFCHASNIWDLQMRPMEDRCSSPSSEDLYANIDLFLDLPNVPVNDCPEIVLEEPAVKFPWEL